MKYFTVAQLQKLLNEDDIVLVDTRSVAEFTGGFIPGSVFIGHEGNMAEWATALLSPEATIVLVTNPGKEEHCAGILSGQGFKNIPGCLDGGIDAWKEAGEAIDMIISVDAGELAMDIPFDEKLLVLDVRKPFEFADGHIKDAVNVPLDELKDPVNIANLEENQNIYIHCARGYRSVIAASLLKQQGYNNIRNVTGGWESIKHTKGFTIEKESSALN